MDSQNIKKADFLDILFEGRNKNYGAYDLRKKYNQRIGKATLIGVLFVTFTFLGIAYANKKSNEARSKVLKEYKLADPPPLDQKKPPPPPPKIDPPPPVRAEVKFVPPVIKKDNEVKTNEMPPKEDLNDKPTGTQNREGDNTPPEGFKADDNLPPPPPPKVEDEDNSVHEIVEQEAEFPGGEGALLAFLSKNINYPNQAQDAGIEGRVMVSFVVEKDGSVSGVKVIRGIGYGCDEEASRVVKKLRGFRPAKQNGKAVRFSYSVPVKFELQ